MIFYLSCTGNTLWAARRLSDATGERLIDIAAAGDDEQHYAPTAGERIGFCFPVHGWRPPLMVRKFIGRLAIDGAEGHYCYALCTAGDNIGETVDLLRSDLKERGIRLDSTFSLLMPESYVGLPFMDVDTPEKELSKIARAAEQLTEIGRYITVRQKGVEIVVRGRWPRINSRVLGAYFTHKLITDKPFHVTDDRCIKCGECARHCPVGNIAWQPGELPAWKHTGRCMTCFACYHHCPKHAIEFGNRTKGKGQYFFKNIHIEKGKENPNERIEI